METIVNRGDWEKYPSRIKQNTKKVLDGYDLDEELPDHSTLSKILDGFGDLEYLEYAV